MVTTFTARRAIPADFGHGGRDISGRPGETELYLQLTNTKTLKDELVAAVNAVEALLVGVDVKASVKVAAPGNVNIAAPGANIDGIAMSATERFLAPLQTAGAESGIYVYNGAAVPATRATDFDESAEVTTMTLVPVEQGTSANKIWELRTTGTIVVGTTAQTWGIHDNGVARAADPTVNDDSGDGYSTTSWWLNTATGAMFYCAAATPTAADWRRVAFVTNTPTDNALMTADGVAGGIQMANAAVDCKAQKFTNWTGGDGDGASPLAFDGNGRAFNIAATTAGIQLDTDGTGVGAKHHAAFTGSEKREISAALQNVDAGAPATTTLATIPIADLFTYDISAKVVVRETGGTARSVFHLSAMVYREGGVAVLGPNSPNADFTDDVAGYLCTIDVDGGNNARVRITGGNAVTTNWVGFIEYHRVSLNA